MESKKYVGTFCLFICTTGMYVLTEGKGMFTFCKHQTLLSGPFPGIMPPGKLGVEDLEALMHASYFSRSDGTVS